MKPPPPAPRMSQASAWTLMSIALCFFFALACARPIDSDDLWIHLMVGRRILDGGGVPHAEFFQYAGAASPQIFGGLGFGLLYEVAVRMFGLAGATLANSAIWGGFALLMALAFGKLARSSRDDFGADERPWLPAAGAAFGVAFAVASLGFCDRLNMRAESTALLGYASCMWALASSIERGSPRRLLAWMPLACLGASLMHTGGFLLLLAWPLALARYSCDPAWRRGPWKSTLALSLAASLLLPMLGPNGAMQSYLHPLGMAIISAKTGQGSALAREAPALAQKEVLELLALTDPRVPPSLKIAWLALALSCCASIAGRALAARGRRRLWAGLAAEAAVAGALLGQAWMHERGVGLCAALLIPTIGLGALAAFRACGLGRSMAAASALAFLGFAMDQSSKDGAWAIQGKATPFDSIAAMIARERPQGSRIFATESANALPYLLGPKHLVGFTEHYLIANPEAERHNMAMQMGSSSQVEAEAERLGVDFACVPYALLLPGGAHVFGLPAKLSRSPSWRMLAMQAPCALFMRLPEGAKLDPAGPKLAWQAARYHAMLADIVEQGVQKDLEPRGSQTAKILADMARDLRDKALRLGPEPLEAEGSEKAIGAEPKKNRGLK